MKSKAEERLVLESPFCTILAVREVDQYPHPRVESNIQLGSQAATKNPSRKSLDIDLSILYSM